MSFTHEFGIENISINDQIEIKGLVYRGDKQLEKGSVVLHLTGEEIEQPTRTSIHIGDNIHVEDDLGRWVNHHCFPNTVVNERNLIATETIIPGDPITFDYLATEKTIANPFICFCCNKRIYK